MKKNTNKKIILGISTLLFVIAIMGITSANFILCLQDNEKVHYCSGYMPDYTHHGDGYTLICMSQYRASEDCYVHGYPCHDGYTCGNNQNQTTEFDLTPPVLTIQSPENNPSKYYSSRKITLQFSLNEVADVYYKDLNKNTATWTRVCTKCQAGSPSNPSYILNRSFSEGENNLMFKAVDLSGNEATQQIKFKVDSVSPRIYKTYPISGKFAEGDFEVQFKEANPKRVTLYYGGKSKNLNIANDCEPGISGKTNCDTSVNLNEFNGQEIEYYFEIEDVAGRTYKSRTTKIKVDTLAPIIKNPTNFFTQGEGRYSRYVTFNMSIIESNLYKVTYTETSKPNSVRTMCTRLVQGNCFKKVSFLPGDHSITIQISDKAGHSIAVPVDFTV